jgi:molybdate transport system substrate-binding protein
LFIGPEEFSDPLLKAGKLQQGSRTAFARSGTGLAVRAGTPKPDISTPEKLKAVLLAAKAVSYSAGASGMHFVKVIQTLGIEDAIVAKRVTPKPGELVGAVVARGDADIAVQQFSELMPVPGIVILDPLPAQLRQTIVYGATLFAHAAQREAAATFVKFLRSAPAQSVLREKGLDPA